MTQIIVKEEQIKLIKSSIRDIPDFPKPGIIFKDITTLISNPEAFQTTIDLFEDKYKSMGVDFVVAPEARGFIFAAPLAARLGAGLTLVRKPGKLPAKTIDVSYELEYGTDTLCIHQDAFTGKTNAKVIIIDDLLATGGSAKASMELIQKAGGNLLGAGFVVELDFLEGRKQLESNCEVFSLIHY